MEQRIIDLARFDEPGHDLRHLPLAVVDVETTGGITGEDRVIEIAIVTVSPGGTITEEWSTLVNPGREVDWNARKVHGISTSDLRDAPSFRQIAGDVMDRLDGSVLVAHNISAEDRFLATEFNEIGKQNLSIPALCTWRLAKRVLPIASHKLEWCCESLDIPLDDAHTALADAYATAQLAPLLIKWETGELSWSRLPRKLPSLKPSGKAVARPVVITRTKTPISRQRPPRPTPKATTTGSSSAASRKAARPTEPAGRQRVWCEPGVPDATLKTLEDSGFTVARYLTASVVAAVCAEPDTEHPKVAQARDMGVVVAHWADLSPLGIATVAPAKQASGIAAKASSNAGAVQGGAKQPSGGPSDRASILIKCPACGKGNRVKKGGKHRCGSCATEFTATVHTKCPACGKTNRIVKSGKHRCGSCRAEFQASVMAAVVDPQHPAGKVTPDRQPAPAPSPSRTPALTPKVDLPRPATSPNGATTSRPPAPPQPPRPSPPVVVGNAPPSSVWSSRRARLGLAALAMVVVLVVALLIGAAGDRPRDLDPSGPTAAPELRALVTAYGRSVDFVSGPADRTARLDESRPPGLSSRIVARTSNGQIRFDRYYSIRDRQRAQSHVVEWQSATAQGNVAPAYASCGLTLVVLSSYTDGAAEYHDAILANQLLRYTAGGDCEDGSNTAAPANQ